MVNNTKGNAGGCGEAGQVLSPAPSFSLATIGINMDEIELIKSQDEALSYLRNNITKDEAYYILTTDKDIIDVLVANRGDGSKRIKILNVEYTLDENDSLLLFDTDGMIDACLLEANYGGVSMYFRSKDVVDILSHSIKREAMNHPYIKVQLDNIPTIEKRRVIFEITGHRVDYDKVDFMFVYFMARIL